MPEPKIKRALISVYDKTGIVDFARALVDEFGIEIISTGGTAALLKENDIPVTLVEDITGFPEMMNGRVKTLHPKIFAAILADRDNPEHMRQLEKQGVKPIDMVVVNLYPFEKTVADPNCTFEQAIEMIDIGGPCLLRAAAKNHRHVLVVDDPEAYQPVLSFLRGEHDRDIPFVEAIEALKHTTNYDASIVTWLSARERQDLVPPTRFFELTAWGQIRYGENPHQAAELIENLDEESIGYLPIAGASYDVCNENMSFNNYVDADAALALCAELTRAGRDVWHRHPAGESSVPVHRLDAGATQVCVFAKHTNACGVGVGEDAIEAYRTAYLGDPNAAMGGILACNFRIDKAFAETVMNTYDRWGRAAGAGGFFAEVWVAPSFEEQAETVIRSAKKWGQRVRLLDVGGMNETPCPSTLEYKTITGGMLTQTKDVIGLNEDQWKVVTERKPTEPQMADLRLAWLICKHTKSNAITICKDNMLIGNGAGQMSRVMSCRIAAWLAKENGHESKLSGSAAASDAFFPFRDGPDMLMDAGVTAIIQPGGSKRDEDTIAACNERGAAMIFTGTRHFRH